MKAAICLPMQGRYKIIARRGDTLEVTKETPWFDNLITTVGLNRIGLGLIGSFALVGSGSTLPTFADTGMQTFVAASDNVTGMVSGTQASAPYFGWTRFTYRFAAGAAAGNLSEVGVGWYNGSTYNAFSRALILDTEGDPTTITVLSDEVLDVVYELRLFPPLVDKPIEVTIGGVDYDLVLRACRVTNSESWNPTDLLRYGAARPDGVRGFLTVYNGAMGLITGEPSGASGGTSNGLNVTHAYSNNSLKRSFTSTYPLDVGNLSGGITTLRIDTTGLGAFQASVTPAIPKDNTKVMSLSFEVAWARKT